MDQAIIRALAMELATKVNGMVNIPLVKDEDEQAFFELIILMVLEIVFNKLGFKYNVEKK